jgi:hypothetical protein
VNYGYSLITERDAYALSANRSLTIPNGFSTSFVQNLVMNYFNSASGLLSRVIFDAVVLTKSSYLMISTGVRFLDVDCSFRRFDFCFRAVQGGWITVMTKHLSIP